MQILSSLSLVFLVAICVSVVPVSGMNDGISWQTSIPLTVLRSCLRLRPEDLPIKGCLPCSWRRYLLFPENHVIFMISGVMHCQPCGKCSSMHDVCLTFSLTFRFSLYDDRSPSTIRPERLWRQPVLAAHTWLCFWEKRLSTNLYHVISGLTAGWPCLHGLRCRFYTRL